MNYTPKQLDLLRFLRAYIREAGCSPTQTEMGAELGISSVTINEHLGCLERKGAITRRKYEARGVEMRDYHFDDNGYAALRGRLKALLDDSFGPATAIRVLALFDAAASAEIGKLP